LLLDHRRFHSHVIFVRLCVADSVSNENSTTFSRFAGLPRLERRATRKAKPRIDEFPKDRQGKGSENPLQGLTKRSLFGNLL
jgi:hypothetical protein